MLAFVRCALSFYIDPRFVWVSLTVWWRATLSPLGFVFSPSARWLYMSPMLEFVLFTFPLFLVDFHPHVWPRSLWLV